jgi:hypothetical protein
MAVTLNASTTTGLEIASDTSGIVTLRNNGTDALSVNSGNLQFNSGYGSVATAYGCRAWVNFNGTGTVAIRASGNVSSITDNGTGNYTINFTNALPDANYALAAMGTSSGVDAAAGTYSIYAAGGIGTAPTTMSTTAVRVIGGGAYAFAVSSDFNVLTIIIFR